MPGNAWGANQYLLCTKEQAWGTFDAAATVFTWIDLFDDSSVEFTKAPYSQTKRRFPSNERGRRLAKRFTHTFSFKTLAFPDQLTTLVPWATALTTVNGRPTLQSFTCDYFDGMEARRFLGCRINRMMITCNNQTDWMEITLSGIAKLQDPVFNTLAAPASSAFSSLAPYSIQDSGGLVKLGTSGGTVKTGYSMLSCTWENLLDPQHDELTTLNTLNYGGRNIDASIRIRNDDNALRLLYENQTALTAFLKWSQTTPVHSLTLDLQDTTYPDGRDVEKPAAGDEYQTIRLQAFQSLVSGTSGVATAA
jgi:hypothetical protein